MSRKRVVALLDGLTEELRNLQYERSEILAVLEYADTGNDGTPRLKWHGGSVPIPAKEARHEFCKRLDQIEARLADLEEQGARAANEGR